MPTREVVLVGCIVFGSDIMDDYMIGEGDGLANKDFEIQNSVTASNITNTNNVEFVVALPATLAADS